MRSDSKVENQARDPNWEPFWYTVTSELVYALFLPPLPSITRSNSPGGRVSYH